MERRRKPLVGMMVAVLLLVQWASVQHVLSHLDDGNATPATHRVASCADCVGSMPLLACIGGSSLAALVLDATVDAVPGVAAAVGSSSRSWRHYKSRAPPR
jgi:hypothetical protein